MSWAPGEEILWCYRREVIPARVVHDDEYLAVWVAPGTSLLTCVPADGRDLRDRPVSERFTCERVFAIREWFGAGTLRLAYPGDAHSSWLFRHGDGSFWGWYGNLEDPLRRVDNRVHTIDHLLDVWVDASGTVGWKDEDELEAAVSVGYFSAAEAHVIRSHGEVVFDAMQRRLPPYDDSWLNWAPDSSWTTPLLPDEFASMAGNAAYPIFPSGGEETCPGP